MSGKFLVLPYQAAQDPIDEAPQPKGWTLIGWRHGHALDWSYLSGWTYQTLNEARNRGKLITAQARIPKTSTFALYVQPVRS